MELSLAEGFHKLNTVPVAGVEAVPSVVPLESNAVALKVTFCMKPEPTFCISPTTTKSPAFDAKDTQLKQQHRSCKTQL